MSSIFVYLQIQKPSASAYDGQRLCVPQCLASWYTRGAPLVVGQPTGGVRSGLWPALVYATGAGHWPVLVYTLVVVKQ